MSAATYRLDKLLESGNASVCQIIYHQDTVPDGRDELMDVIDVKRTMMICSEWTSSVLNDYKVLKQKRTNEHVRAVSIAQLKINDVPVKNLDDLCVSFERDLDVYDKVLKILDERIGQLVNAKVLNAAECMINRRKDRISKRRTNANERSDVQT